MDGLRVSTITCCTEITSDICLKNLYKQVNIDDFIRYHKITDKYDIKSSKINKYQRKKKV